MTKQVFKNCLLGYCTRETGLACVRSRVCYAALAARCGDAQEWPVPVCSSPRALAAETRTPRVIRACQLLS